MQLNILAGRSFNDLSQYPVFPWIFVDYSNDIPPDLQAFDSVFGGAAPGGFRDLNKNMQLLGSAERQAEFKRKYEDNDSFIAMNDKFHCGSHYSNPGIVLHYLNRVSPYIDACVELHGKSLDKPDRTFHSIKDSLYSALNDYSDVRELIPEFFFMPEMFVNLNHVNFGTRQDGIVVDDVILPQWCNQDPYLFVIYMREALESPYVSQNLGGWIDYIFGYKQRDIEAEKSLNIYSTLTYEDGVDLDEQHDEFLKNSQTLQIYNYGQTPSQLLKGVKHQGKQPKATVTKYNNVIDMQAKIRVYKPINPIAQNMIDKSIASGKNDKFKLLCNEAIICARFLDDEHIVAVCKEGSIIYFKWISKSHEINPNTPFICCEEKKKKIDAKMKVNGIDHYDRSLNQLQQPVIIMTHGKSILRGGFWDGKIVVSPFDSHSSDQQRTLLTHQATVTSIVANTNEKIIITGTKLGDIIVWNHVWNTQQQYASEPQWQVRKHLCQHQAQISSIYINEDMNMYVTASVDGTANVYNLWSDIYLRTFQHPSYYQINSVILTQTPLTACCFFSIQDHQWYSFSLNGHFLDQQTEECNTVISAQVIKDSNFMDKLVYGTEKGCLVFRQLPLLKQIKKQIVSTTFSIISILISPDKRFLLVGCGDGGLNIITDPNLINIAPNNATIPQFGN